LTELERKYEFFLDHPKLIEHELMYGIRTKNKDILKCLINFMGGFMIVFPMVRYNQQINDTNIWQVINLIWNNNWEGDTWDNSNIYNNDFKKICRTPVYIPFIYAEIISGEYILYLLHPQDNNCIYTKMNISNDSNSLYFIHKINIPYLDNDDSSYNLDDDRIRRTRFIGAKNDKGITILSQFENKLGISFDTISNGDVYGKDHRIWKSTASWQLFEEYAFSAYDINSELGETTYLLDLLYESYVANNVLSSFNINMSLSKRYNGLLLFKTILFQHISDEELRGDINYIGLCLSAINNLIFKITNRLRHHLYTIYEYKNTGSAQLQRMLESSKNYYLSWGYNLFDDILTIASLVKPKQCYICSKQLERGNVSLMQEYQKYKDIDDFEKIEVTNKNIYQVIILRILLTESIATIKNITNTFKIPLQSDKDTIAILRKENISLNTIIGASNWNEFRTKHHRIIELFFPEKGDKELKQIWLLAIKVILYCTTRESNTILKKWLILIVVLICPKRLPKNGYTIII